MEETGLSPVQHTWLRKHALSQSNEEMSPAVEASAVASSPVVAHLHRCRLFPCGLHRHGRIALIQTQPGLCLWSLIGSS